MLKNPENGHFFESLDITLAKISWVLQILAYCPTTFPNLFGSFNHVYS
jgi:hypothetical protein